MHPSGSDFSFFCSCPCLLVVILRRRRRTCFCLYPLNSRRAGWRTSKSGCPIFATVSSSISQRPRHLAGGVVRWAIAPRAIRFPYDARLIHRLVPPGRARSNPPHQAVVHPEPGRARLQSGHKGPPQSGHRSAEGRKRSPKDAATEYCRCSSPGTPAYSTSYNPQPQETSANSHVKPRARQNSSRKTHNQIKINHLRVKK